MELEIWWHDARVNLILGELGGVPGIGQWEDDGKHGIWEREQRAASGVCIIMLLLLAK